MGPLWRRGYSLRSGLIGGRRRRRLCDWRRQRQRDARDRIKQADMINRPKLRRLTQISPMPEAGLSGAVCLQVRRIGQSQTWSLDPTITRGRAVESKSRRSYLFSHARERAAPTVAERRSPRSPAIRGRRLNRRPRRKPAKRRVGRNRRGSKRRRWRRLTRKRLRGATPLLNTSRRYWD